MVQIENFPITPGPSGSVTIPTPEGNHRSSFFHHGLVRTFLEVNINETGSVCFVWALVCNALCLRPARGVVWVNSSFLLVAGAVPLCEDTTNVHLQPGNGSLCRSTLGCWERACISLG